MSPRSGPAHLLIVAGLAFEARAAQRAAATHDDVRVLYGVGEQGLGDRLDEQVAGARALLSFGTAGALASSLRVGDWIVADGVLAADSATSGVALPVDAAWCERLSERLAGACRGPLLGVARPVTTLEARRALQRETGAVAADMESLVLARAAARHGVPFCACRVVIDDAARTLPDAALAGMRPDGAVAPLRVIAALARRPWELPALLSLARDAGHARRRLQHDAAAIVQASR